MTVEDELEAVIGGGKCKWVYVSVASRPIIIDHRRVDTRLLLSQKSELLRQGSGDCGVKSPTADVTVVSPSVTHYWVGLRRTI